MKTELDWYASVGSPALREDIQREQQRFPLDAFVGMTMSDALDFINSNWSPASSVEKNLVPDSDGRWAYYIHNGVYLEYPIQYSAQVSGSAENYVYFMPSTGMPEQWHPFVMKVVIWHAPSDENNPIDVHSWYSSENISWEIPVQTAEFQGVELIKKHADSSMDAHAFLYNQENQLGVDIWVFVFEPPLGDETLDYLQLVNQRYEYFQHMVDNIKIVKP